MWYGFFLNMEQICKIHAQVADILSVSTRLHESYLDDILYLHHPSVYWIVLFQELLATLYEKSRYLVYIINDQIRLISEQKRYVQPTRG